MHDHPAHGVRALEETSDTMEVAKDLARDWAIINLAEEIAVSDPDMGMVLKDIHWLSHPLPRLQLALAEHAVEYGEVKNFKKNQSGVLLPPWRRKDPRRYTSMRQGCESMFETLACWDEPRPSLCASERCARGKGAELSASESARGCQSGVVQERQTRWRKSVSNCSSIVLALRGGCHASSYKNVALSDNHWRFLLNKFVPSVALVGPELC